uniref:NADH-ubiquinone oxidoreductase chain 4 n=1 Tax=Chytriomyces confervae TaxID=246404 RepID=A0A4P8NP44_9FUNG|nr:NADH dehydrogenase subunit 4 [Chytriomyces confervae]QCQ69059.1 NADH dehydrogenase subunit 4 [Chytriomyces confervae]
MLSILLVLPLLSMLTISLLNSARSILLVALVYSILSLLHTYNLMLLFDSESSSLFQMQSTGPIEGLLAIDGISLWLIWLVNMLMPIVILSVYKSVAGLNVNVVSSRVSDEGIMASSIKQMLILLIFIGFWSVAVFLVQNILLFYISFEGALIPMYFLILHYGSRNKKIHASYMFFIYTLAGSLCLFLALLGLYLENGTGDYQILLMNRNSIEPTSYELILWMAFFICFSIKLPIIGFHGWLLAAHVEAPTSASVILAAILLKMGSYGLIRYNIPLFPFATEYFRPFVVVLCVLGILYSSIAALSQSDMKIIIAYSSIGHMGTATLGLFSNDYLGIMGSLYFLISHGLISAGLFLLVGVIYDRYHTRNIMYYRGLVQAYPIYVLLLLVFSMANSAVPGTSGFAGEFLSLLGAFNLNPFVAILAALSVVMVPAFMLRLLHSISYGEFTKYMPVVTSDVSAKELAMFLPLVFFTMLLGIYPEMMLQDVLEASINLTSSIS